MTTKRPEVSSGFAQKELDKAEKQFEAFDENIKSLTKDRMDMAPKEEADPQFKMSQNQIARTNDFYLKPKKRIGSKEKFNEQYREAYNFDKEFVHFMAQNNEIIGEGITIWTKPYAGVPAEEWDVPVNKPVWGPRYLAEQIKRKYYHRLVMKDHSHSVDGMGTYTGVLAADTTVQRLDCHPVSEKKTLFMGKSGF